MTEAELLLKITAEAGRLGLYWHHDPDSRRPHGTPGFPDLILAGPGGILWRELKTEGGQLSRDQQKWRRMLERSSQNWGIWRPADLDNGQVPFDLTSLSLGAGAR